MKSAFKASRNICWAGALIVPTLLTIFLPAQLANHAEAKHFFQGLPAWLVWTICYGVVFSPSYIFLALMDRPWRFRLECMGYFIIASLLQIPWLVFIWLLAICMLYNSCL